MKKDMISLRAWIREKIEIESEALRRIHSAGLTPTLMPVVERQDRMRRYQNVLETSDEFDEYE